MKIIKKFFQSKYYFLLKRFFTLDGKRQFIISSISYYLLISLVPLCTITYYFLQLFGVEENTFNQWILAYIPLLSADLSFSITNLFSHNFATIISTIISIYIASKGLGNYYQYLIEKYRITPLKYPFISNKIYASITTLFLCIFIGLFTALRFSLFSSFFERFTLLSAVSLNVGIFFLILFLNYILLRRKISIKKIAPGSLLTTLLFEGLSYFFTYYFSTAASKEKYYGLFTDIIILLLFLYLLSYFLLLGNQLNYMIIELENKKNR